MLTTGIIRYYQNRGGITPKSSKTFQGNLLLCGNMYGNILNSSSKVLN